MHANSGMTLDDEAKTDHTHSRIYWQCRRGMLELDLLLQGFCAQKYAELSPRERELFEQLLEYPDHALHGLLMGSMRTSDRDMAELLGRIRDAAGA